MTEPHAAPAPLHGRPNFIVLVTDDQGYGDLSCLPDTDVRTPNLDALCAGGVRFTDWYANAPVCSPTRASLLTGRYPARTGVTNVLPGHRQADGLNPGVPTLAELLGQRGYRCYLSGKWHLGVTEESRPHRRGFDHWFGHLAGCIDYYSHIYYWDMNQSGPGLNPSHDLWEDGEEIWRNGAYMTYQITGKAIEYIRDAARRDEPFFLYLSYNAPHYPMHAPQEYLNRFDHLPWDRQVMAAMLSAVDDGVGQIMDELSRLGIAQDTCTFFTSDNGPSAESRNWLDGRQDPYYGGSASKFRGHKLSLFEGGIRVPGVAHWPTRIQAGQVLDGPCATMDIVPTVLSAAGADQGAVGIGTGEVDQGSRYDGVDLLPYLTGTGLLPERDLYWALDAPGSHQTAIRRGNWKLVLNGVDPGADYDVDPVQLSDLETDPSETHNLVADHPELAVELTVAAERWRQDMNIAVGQ